MADQTDAQRLAEQRERDLVKQGRDLERTESRLTWLEKRAMDVNGQIKDLTGAVTRVADGQVATNLTLTQIVTKLETRDGDADRSGERTFKRWQTIGVLFAIFCGVLGLVFVAINTFHGLPPTHLITITTSKTVR